MDLTQRGRDVRRFVSDVESLVIEALRDVGVGADQVTGRRGVSVGGERKIASVGVAVESWVTFHGFALNVSNDLAPFRAFHPCGLPGTVMTSVSEELGRRVSTDALRGPVIAAWERRFTSADGPANLAPSIGAAVLVR